MPIYELTEARHGRFLVNRNDTYVGRSVLAYGEWSEAEVQLFRQIVRPGDVVLEAGANIGTHTVPISAMVGDGGRVYAFEAARSTHQLLCANLALNERFNVHALNKAIGRTVDTVRFPAIDPRQPFNFGCASLRGAEQQPSEATESVDMLSIDSMALDRLDFIKSDIEGFELEMLEGARETLGRLRPVVYLEVDSSNGRPTGNRDELVSLLESFGYGAYYYIAPMFLSDNARGVQEDIFRSSSLDLICVPEDKAHIEGLSRATVGDQLIHISAEKSSIQYAALPWNGARFHRR
ncbi:FkbM family methyltransferase [Variovorax paradoxus]|nr:FkbM family methyltransferase [Variovorax paradoxus]